MSLTRKMYENVKLHEWVLVEVTTPEEENEYLLGHFEGEMGNGIILKNCLRSKRILPLDYNYLSALVKTQPKYPEVYIPSKIIQNIERIEIL